MCRFFDFLFSILGIIFLFPIFLVLVFIGLFDTGSPLFLQQRVGKNQKIFTLIKFRTMKKNTESVATHLASAASVTKYGSFLRRTKLDELPQLINVALGHMSLVGPRPNLANQTELIDERSLRGVYSVRPGITGLAQIQGIDMSTPEKLAATDQNMIENLSVKSYFIYIFKTLLGSGSGDRINNNV